MLLIPARQLKCSSTWRDNLVTPTRDRSVEIYRPSDTTIAQLFSGQNQLKQILQFITESHTLSVSQCWKVIPKLSWKHNLFAARGLQTLLKTIPKLTAVYFAAAASCVCRTFWLNLDSVLVVRIRVVEKCLMEDLWRYLIVLEQYDCVVSLLWPDQYPGHRTKY